MTEGWPKVTAVLPTHDRPVLMRRALNSILAQDYPGELDVVVVFDQAEPDQGLARAGEGRQVSVITNARKTGLAGARNSGILVASGAYIASCDDDDAWEVQSSVVRSRHCVGIPVRSL